MNKADVLDRTLSVKTELGSVDADIANSEARIRLLKREQALDEKVAALSEVSIRVPDHDSPEYPAYRQRMDEEADARRAEIEREQEAIQREWAGLR
ncbi:hypothetical protein [Arthrobacter sp. NPDC058127]|uniref:hypothetical protein n=1 Tax=Arthrobacter sp. NPDC058127 TaxID=3346351 RepID=UPI0036E97556